MILPELIGFVLFLMERRFRLVKLEEKHADKILSLYPANPHNKETRNLPLKCDLNTHTQRKILVFCTLSDAQF